MPRTNSLLLDGERWHRLAFARVATPADLGRVLGTPKAVPLGLFGAVEFWSPEPVDAAPNRIADCVLRALIEDAADGHYIVSDSDWERAKALATDPGSVPSLYGPCVLAGVGAPGSLAPLPDRFSRWWGMSRDRIVKARPGTGLAS